MLKNDDLRDKQVQWEYLQYEIRQFTICFSKDLAKEVRKETISRGKYSKVLLLITIMT